MIVLRYLSRELLQSWLAISGILLLIIVSGRFIKYLQEAVSGDINPNALLAIMGYRMPGFLEMILPLGFFLAILFAYGRLYAESEMVVLEACGQSPVRLLKYTAVPALLVMLIVAANSLLLSPWGAGKVQRIFSIQAAMSELDNLSPGRFLMSSSGNRVTYTEGLNDEKTEMHGVFIAQVGTGKTAEGMGQEMSILLADVGRLHTEPATGNRYLLLDNGYRYDLQAGMPKSRIARYDTYGVLMKKRSPRTQSSEETLPLAALMDSNRPERQAELQWRISLPLVLPVIVLMGLPLARVNPRQGRYFKLLPGILLYLLYISLLISARGAVDDGKLPPEIGLWGVHVLFLLVGLLMFFGRPLKEALGRLIRGKKVGAEA